MRVNELAKSSSITSDAVRYYTRIGLLHPKRDSINGYRKYSAEDLQRAMLEMEIAMARFSVVKRMLWKH